MQLSCPSRHRAALRLVAATAALAASLPSLANSMTFSGTLTRSNPPAGPGGRCAPALTVINDPVLYTSTGTSNLGSFLNTASACLLPPPPTSTYDGVFRFDFASGDSLSGTTSSVLSLSGTPGLFNIAGDFVITGGTGQFLGATGGFTEVGTLDFRTPGVAVALGSFSGVITTVPEPATWAFMLGGLGGLGALGRATRRSDARRACLTA